MLLALAVVHAAAEAASRTSGSGRATTTTTRGAYRPTRTGSPARASTTSSRDALLDVPAPRLTSRRAPLRLCDGVESLPAGTILFSEETLCLEQPLPGVTRGEARNKGLHAASVNVTFAGTRVDATHVTAPTLIVPSEDGEDFLGPDAEEDEETSPKPDDHVVDVFVRFNLNVAGLPTRTKGTLEASVEIEPLGRFYYDIVWYELSVTYPTFYSHQVEVTVQEGIDQDKSEEEIETDVEDLKEGSATFFPCTNFIAGPFCDEAGISA